MPWADGDDLTPTNLNNVSGQVFNVKDADYGAVGDGVTDDTVAIQAAIDAAAAVRGVVTFPPSATPWMFSNLLVNANMSLIGSGMNQTILKRVAGATGTAIRERTAAEGNPSGATGLRIAHLQLDGNGTTGNGFDIGNQVGGAQFNFNASMDHVHARSFPSGIGILLFCNAIRCSYLWANLCDTGIKLANGGHNTYNGLWAEGNSTYNLWVEASDYNSFYGIHTEGAAAPTHHVFVSGNQNRFNGISISLQVDHTGKDIVRVSNTAGRNAFYGVALEANANAFANLIYDDGPGIGSGNSQYFIPFWLDTEADQRGYIYSGSLVGIAPLSLGSGYLEAGEISDPTAPATNAGRLYFKDNGSGKTQLVARFPTGAVQVIATEP